MSHAVMAWNIAPIFRVLWPVPLMVKEMVIYVVVPIGPHKRIGPVLVWAC